MPVTVVVIIRSVISFFMLLLFVRIMGKQQVSQLTFFDYVVGITIGSIASTLSVQVNENTFATLVGMGIWTVLAIVIAVIGMKSIRFRRIIDGEPSVVIQNGKILSENLKRIRIPTSELIAELRTKGVFNISDVEFALFEPGGKISIQKKSQKQPLTPSDLKIPTEYDGMPTNLVMDGVIMYNALKSLNLTKAWLHHQLGKQGITDTSEITIAQLDTKGNLYVDLKGDKPYYIISTTE